MAATEKNLQSALRSIAIRTATVAWTLGCIALWPGGLHASETGNTLSLELNGLRQAGEACRVVFVAQNGLGGDLDELSLEIVAFDRQGIVSHLTIFDFAALPEGRPRVRRFELADTQCETIGRVLINGIAACKGAQLDGQACETGLRLVNKTGIDFLN